MVASELIVRSFESGIFPGDWKEADAFLVHKECEKQLLKMIAQYRYFIFVEKYYKNLFSIKYMNFS